MHKRNVFVATSLLGGLFLIVGGLLTPMLVRAQVPPGYNPCWTLNDCQAAHGLWGKDTGEGQSIDGGESVRRKCQPTSTNEETAVCWNIPPNIPLQIGIPGVTDKFCSVYDKNGEAVSCSSNPDVCKNQGLGSCRPGVVGGFAGYLSKFYKFFVYALAVFAVTLISWGGFKRIMAAGSSERIKDANDVIYQAIIGLVLALISYSLLNLINPKLVSLEGARLEKIKTQTFGDWCQVDLKDEHDNFVACNTEYRDPKTGYTCRGQRCEVAEQGCYAIGYNSDTKRLKYDCKKPNEACAMIDDDNVGDIAGIGTGNANDFLALDRVCESYSDAYGQCTWVEHGTPSPLLMDAVLYRSLGENVVTVSLDAISNLALSVPSSIWHTVGSLFGDDDKCEYYSNDFKAPFCKGTNEHEFDYTGQEKKRCTDLNSPATGVLSGKDWAACAHNWCRTINPNWQDGDCVPVWNRTASNWYCARR